MYICNDALYTLCSVVSDFFLHVHQKFVKAVDLERTFAILFSLL